MSQPHTQCDGRIRFSAISLPAFPDTKTGGMVVVTVRLKGKANDTEVTSDPAEGGQVTFEDNPAFTPLYLAGNESGLGGTRRFGDRDPGWDSWATPQTISWLQTKSYGLNDISGQHIAETPAGRSTLGHAGHSDGQQIDMRCADGQGGFSENLGGAGEGAGILQRLNRARQKVANNSPPKPQLAALKSWLSANRGMLETEAAAPGAGQRCPSKELKLGTKDQSAN